MRDIIPDITFIDYRPQDDSFKVRWHVTSKVEGEVNIASKESLPKITFNGTERVEWFIIPYATNPHIGRTADAHLGQMENLIKANCK